jgi:hypothetical protein
MQHCRTTVSGKAAAAAPVSASATRFGARLHLHFLLLLLPLLLHLQLVKLTHLQNHCNQPVTNFLVQCFLLDQLFACCCCCSPPLVLPLRVAAAGLVPSAAGTSHCCSHTSPLWQVNSCNRLSLMHHLWFVFCRGGGASLSAQHIVGTSPCC